MIVRDLLMQLQWQYKQFFIK